MVFSEKVVRLRKGLGLSQEEFGDLFNVSRQAISKWELGQSKPDIDTIITLCEVLEISSDELILPDRPEKANEEIFKTKSDLAEIMRLKRRFNFGIYMAALGFLSAFWIWLDIRVGSNFMTTFSWGLRFYPSKFFLLISAIGLIIFGLAIALKATKK